MLGFIYKLTSPSGKIYIGQTIDIKRRLKEYSKPSAAKSQPKLSNSFKKYGFNSFTIDILFKGECTIDFLNDIEIYYVKKYDSVNNGLNLQHGGLNGLHSEYTKQKMSNSAKIICSNKDYIYNRNKHWIGRKHKQESKEKMSKKRKGIPLTAELAEKIRQRVIERGGKIVLNFETGIFYKSANEAACSINHLKYTSLKNKLNGNKRNNTSFFYV